LSQPGADLTVLLSLLERHGSVRLMTTMLSGELGSNTPVEISAVGDKIAQPEFFGLVIRDTTIRPQESAGAPDEGASIVAALSEGLSLGELVKASKSEIEQKNILAMLELCHGNKAATAKRLGFSRQSLHSKLKRYHLNEK
jgi:DNA-binding NtrC family response regulator